MATVNTFTDYTASQQDIERRRKMAEMLQQQSIQPLDGNQTAGGYVIPVSPFAGLAKMLQGYVGTMGQKEATDQQKALAQQMRTEATTWAAGMPQAQTRDLNLVPGDDEGNAMPAAMQTTQPTKAQMMSFALQGLSSGNPLASQIAAPFLTQAMKQDEDYTLGEGQQRFRGGNVIAQGGPRTFAPPVPKTATPFAVGAHRDVQIGDQNVTQEYQADGTWQEIGRGPRFAKQVGGQTTIHNAAAVTPVTIQDPNNPNATIIIDGRTRQVLGAGPKLSQIGGAEQKLQLALPQARQRLAGMSQNIDKLDSALNELHDDKGLSRITGTVMGRTPNITNTATGAQGTLNSIKSQIFQESLRSMREASKTGGAVGNVSDREGDKLERTIAALDQAQGTDKFKAELKKAIAQVRLSKEIIQNAFDEQFAGVETMQQGGGQPQRRSSDPSNVINAADAIINGDQNGRR